MMIRAFFRRQDELLAYFVLKFLSKLNQVRRNGSMRRVDDRDQMELRVLMAFAGNYARAS